MDQPLLPREMEHLEAAYVQLPNVGENQDHWGQVRFHMPNEVEVLAAYQNLQTSLLIS